MIVLPVSRSEISLRLPDGKEELLLAEAPSLDDETAVALLSRVASPKIDWERVPVTDLEAALLELRRITGGDLLRAELGCPAKGCGARADLSFGISEFLDSHQPRVPKPVEAAGEWFRSRGCEFRVPLVADRKRALGARDPEDELRNLCVRAVSPAGITRAERALSLLAPGLSRVFRVACPECGARIQTWFPVVTFVLEELRQQAVLIYEDVHLLASHYCWGESRILALPRPRRLRYVELIEMSGSTA